MVDTPEAPVTPAATPAAPSSDPANTAVPVASPSTETAPAAPVETAAPADAPVETAKPETPVPPAVESVLGDAKPAETKPAGDKPAEAAKPDEKKAETAKEEAPTEVKPELPVYEPFKVPENVTLEKEPLDAFTKILGEIETGKLDHAGMQAKGQELIDLAAKQTVESINRYTDSLVQFHENQKKTWFESFKSDPEMGGEKLDATVSTLRDAVEQYAGNETQVAEFRALMKETGVGNHPAVIRLLYNMQQKINKFTTEGDGNRIVPGGKPAPTVVRDYQRFYTGGVA